MSFGEIFEERWKNIIEPAISDVQVDGSSLLPHRVDLRKVGDSIITEIIAGISNDLLVFADITTVGSLGGRPVRNANVLYEVGIAHAIRAPEEVLLFRSDEDPLLFDVASIRVRRYMPDKSPEESKRLVRDAIVDALREVDLVRQAAVAKAARSLDFASWSILLFAQGVVKPPRVRTMRDVMRNVGTLPAITRLLEMGALETEYKNLAQVAVDDAKLKAPLEDLLTYNITRFGRSVLAYGAQKMGITKELLEKIGDEGDNPPDALPSSESPGAA
jgi:hypothetical protein